MKGYGLVHLISAPYEALNVCSCLIWWVVREAQKPGSEVEVGSGAPYKWPKINDING